MTIKITPDLLEWAYELIVHTDPFVRWKLPDGHEITFKVIRSDVVRGDYYRDKKTGRPVIRISSRCHGTLPNLLETMAHEAIHLYQDITRTAGRSEHNAAFHGLAKKVCAIHKFDPKAFA